MAEIVNVCCLLSSCFLLFFVNLLSESVSSPCAWIHFIICNY